MKSARVHHAARRRGGVVAARGEAQPEKMRRIGVLMPYSVEDVLGLELASALRHGLLQHGWAEGRNIEINYRWIGKDGDRRSVYAAELVAASPDVLFACYLAQLAPSALRRARFQLSL